VGATYPLHDPGSLEILAQTDAQNTEEARSILIETMENLAKQPVTDEEVERAKLRFQRGRERLVSSSQALAIQLSEWAASGDWRLFFVHRDRLEKVTSEDVNRVAAKYIVRSNRTVGVYIPTEQAERAEVPAAPDVASLVNDYKGRAAIAMGEAFDPTPENIEQRTARGTIGKALQYAMLPKKTRGESVVVRLNLRVGNAKSLKGQNAVFDFLGSMMLYGTKTKTRQQIADEFAKLKASVSISTDGDSALGLVSITLNVKKGNLPEALVLLQECLRESTFPEKEFEVMKRESLDGLEQGKTEPQVLALVAMRRKMSTYGKDDVRYVPTLEEATERVKAATVEDVRKLYAEQVSGQAGELVVVGDFDPEPTLIAFTTMLAEWTCTTPYERIPREFTPNTGGVEVINTPDKANALYIAAMKLQLSDTDPEYAQLVLGNYILGEAPLASRLSNRVRGKDGLSYGVGSNVAASPKDNLGNFLVFAISNPANIDKVDAAVKEELDKFLKDGLSASEVEEAKKAWIAGKKAERANDSALASQLATSLFAGRRMKYYSDLEQQVEKLQPGDVKRAFDQLLNPKELVIIKAGDMSKLKKDEK
jgi:zinc protease